MERLSRLTGIVAFLLFGGIVISLYSAFQQLFVDGHWIAFGTAVAVSAVMVVIFAKIAMVSDRRYTAWVRQKITGVNAKYLFGLLLILWLVGMSFIGLQGGSLSFTQIGGLALIGLFAGVFIFMGFIWAVIGE
jgi:drug/metabolite transporter (DMT)-like permease